MPAGAFVDAGGQAFAFVALGTLRQHEAAVAVAAFDEVVAAHLQPYARVAERTADAVAGHAARTDGDHLRRRDGIRPDGNGRFGGADAAAILWDHIEALV